MPPDPIPARWHHPHNDAPGEHRLAYVRPWRANWQGRTNTAMHEALWQLWCCQAPGCMAQVIIANVAIAGLAERDGSW